jgi:hypothetical protein
MTGAAWLAIVEQQWLPAAPDGLLFLIGSFRVLLSAKAAHGTHEAWHGLTEWFQTIPLEPFLSKNMCAHIDKDTHTETYIYTAHTYIYMLYIYIDRHTHTRMHTHTCTCYIHLEVSNLQVGSILNQSPAYQIPIVKTRERTDTMLRNM